MKKHWIRVSIAAFIGMLFIQSCSNHGGNGDNGAVTLKLNPKPGAKYKFKKESKEVIAPEMKGTPITINQDMTIESTYQFSTGNPNRKINFTYDRIAIKSGNSLMSLEYDSDDPTKQGQQIFHDIQKVLHKQRTATIATDGTITNITGGDVANNTNPDNEQLTEFSDSSIHSMLSQLFNIYPDKTVQLGDSWEKHNTTYISFIKSFVDYHYKLTSISNNTADIEVNANVISDSTVHSDVKNLKMRGIQTGTIDVDVNTGMILDCKLSTKLTGTMDMMGSPAPTTITSDVHITGREQ